MTTLADAAGTPLYVYSQATLRRHYQVFKKAFEDIDALIAYSVKANSNIAVLKVLAREGAGADVVSGGELRRALHVGIDPKKIVFSGVGKQKEEMAAALAAGIYQFNVESAAELELLNETALENKRKAPIALRINPDIAAGGHAHISTGKSGDKFGVPWTQARALYREARGMAGLDIVGVDLHIGSQIDDLAPFEAATIKAAQLIDALRADGARISRLDLGGGLGIPYGHSAAPPHPDDYAAMIKRVTARLGVQLIFEPGRMIAGNAGILLSRVLYVKETDTDRFLILDAGMNDLIRPALYGSHHDIWPVTKHSGAALVDYDVVGPVCETTDRFAKKRPLPELRRGDLVAFMSAGAYGASQASQYNSRPLVAEALINGAQFKLIRERPRFETMISGETIPEWLI